MFLFLGASRSQEQADNVREVGGARRRQRNAMSRMRRAQNDDDDDDDEGDYEGDTLDLLIKKVIKFKVIIIMIKKQ